MIALILFMPAVYLMGVAHGKVCKVENLEGSSVQTIQPSTAQVGMPSVEPTPKCTKCAKVKYCMNPSTEMSLFCR